MNQINFRVTEKEYARLCAKAEKKGLSVPMYAKQKALKGKVLPPLISKEKGDLIIDILKNNNNIMENMLESDNYENLKEVTNGFQKIIAIINNEEQGQENSPELTITTEKQEEQTKETPFKFKVQLKLSSVNPTDKGEPIWSDYALFRTKDKAEEYVTMKICQDFASYKFTLEEMKELYSSYSFIRVVEDKEEEQISKLTDIDEEPPF